MANRERVIVALLVLFTGLILTGCQTHPYSKLENEVYNYVDKLSRKIPKTFIEEEMETRGSSETYSYHDQGMDEQRGKGRIVRYTRSVASLSSLMAGYMDLADIKAWQEDEKLSELKPNSVIAFVAMRPLGKYDDPENYDLARGGYVVRYYRRKAKGAPWIRAEMYFLRESVDGEQYELLGETIVPAGQVQRYIALAKRFDETYSLPIGEPGTILEASIDGDLDKVKACVQRRPELVNAKNADGQTPLHFAAWFGHKEAAEFLIANGAEVNVKDKSGKTPLDIAVREGHKEVADLLRKHGAE